MTTDKPETTPDPTDYEGRERLNALLTTVPAGKPLLHSAADEIERLREIIRVQRYEAINERI